MDSPFHLVGCVLAARPAPDLVDAYVTQVRRERGAVLVKSAQGATFVRFGAGDARLVTLAVEMARATEGTPAARLRFGFAVGSAAEEGLDVPTRSVMQANDLAAGAEDGEVLVSPQLAVVLIEAGLPLRSRQVALPGGRTVAACTLGLAAAPDERVRAAPAAASPSPATGQASARARAAGGLAPLSPLAPAGLPLPFAAGDGLAEDGDEPLAQVYRALAAQAGEIARRQAELEARQDAVLGKMTLVDDGGVSRRRLAEMESELEAQVARVEERLHATDQVDQRVSHVVAVLADVERRLSAQLQRREEVESLKALVDTLLGQMVQAQPRLEAMAALQQRLLPLADEVGTLAASTAASRQALGGVEGRLHLLGEGLAALDRGLEALAVRVGELAERRPLVQEVHDEVARVRELGERSRADIEHLTGRAGELATLGDQVERLIARLAETDQRLSDVDARRPQLEEAQASVGHVAHLLADIQLKLELLAEQRGAIDHAGDQLARLDFTVREAHNTLRALQREREVAERIEQGIKALRARAGASQAG